jgi:uncharacterized protein (TIGR03435 family)
MKRILQAVSVASLAAGMALSQSPADQPVFEAADVHVGAPGASQGGSGLRAGRVEFRGATLLRLITTAYNVDETKVSGGPPWLDTDRFDIIAKAPSGSSGEALHLMLKALLAERFNLAVHNDEKALPVFILTAAKRGVQMKESSGGDPQCNLTAENGLRTYACHNVTMENLAERLRAVAAAYFDQPVLDQTGLKGGYDFTLKWNGKGVLGAPGSESAGISAFDALDKQLGLKAELKSQKAPVIVVDHVNQKPTDNPPGVMEKIPPPITQFDVAEIKPSKSTTEGNATMKNGRLNATAFSLKDMISMAYDMDDSMVIGEKWLETERFDIVAKTAASASFEELQAMARNLLEDRFKLVVHKEDRPVPVYALTAPKKSSKLKTADGAARAGCKQGSENGLRTLTCQNTTMAQFADRIRQTAGGYLDHPVVDLTGLPGAYDFVLTWTPVGRIGGRGGEAQPAAPVPTAAEPAPTLTVFEAVDKQLGLKLTAAKHPLPVIVVDHAERKPTEN